MIESAADFVRLRTSEVPGEQYRATHDAAAVSVWRAVVEAFPDMRECVACNKTVPVEILWELSRDPDSRVRVAVAMKRKLPEALQLVLANDPDEGVRHRIACNAKATRRVLQILVDDRQSFVREKAVGRLEEGDFVA